MRIQEILTEDRSDIIVYHGNQGGIDIDNLQTPMWWCEDRETAEQYAGDDGIILTARLSCKNPYVIKSNIDETNHVLEQWKKLEQQGYDSIYDPNVGDWIPFYSKDIHVTNEGNQELGASIQMKITEILNESLSYNSSDFIDSILRVVPDASEIWLHGSRATNTHRKNSDTDILVIVPDNIVGDSYLKVVRSLQKLATQYDNYDIQPSKSNSNISKIAKEEGKLLWKAK